MISDVHPYPLIQVGLPARVDNPPVQALHNAVLQKYSISETHDCCIPDCHEPSCAKRLPRLVMATENPGQA